MTDLVKRLRDYRLNHSGIKHKLNLYDEAADRIEELENPVVIHHTGESVILTAENWAVVQKRISELEQQIAALEDERSDFWKDKYRRQVAISDQQSGCIRELEASDRGRVQYIRKLVGQVVERQCKYDALVKGINRLIDEWEQVQDPSENFLMQWECAALLRALLENDDDQVYSQSRPEITA